MRTAICLAGVVLAAIVLSLSAAETNHTNAVAIPDGGIGVLMRSVDEEGLHVLAVSPSSPAERAGIRNGDVIVEVNATPLRNKTLKEAGALVRGPVGSEVELKIVRLSQQEPIILKLKRELLASARPSGSTSSKPRTVEERLRDLEERVRRLELAGDSPRRDAEGNLDKLLKIKLPPNPTQDDVKQYVGRILAVSSGQQRCSSTDPQVEMLAAVGSQHLPVLLDSCRRSDSTFYLLLAIQRLVKPEHKQRILDALPKCHELVRVVHEQGWADDARKTLVTELHNWPKTSDRFYGGRYLPTEWIEAVASFRDKSTYDDLKMFLIEGANRSFTYRAIKDLPGIELKDTVAAAWRRACEGDHESAAFAPVAAERGHVDALERIFAAFDDTGPYQHIRNPREIILHLTEATGSNEELKQWFQKNRDNLVFDEKAQKFRVKKAAR